MITDVRRLRALEAVAARQSFSAAAEDLGYTQSAISQQVVALEREVGLTLVERGLRPVQLTEAGQRLLEHVTPVFEHLANAEAALDTLRGMRTGRLRVAGFASAFATFLPHALAAFVSDHPGVEVELRECEPAEALRLLRSGRVDVAVVYEWAGAEGTADASLDVLTLGEDELRAVLPPRHRLARRKAVRLEQLARERWIVPSAGGPAAAYRALLERLWEQGGVRPEIAFETDDPAAAMSLAAAGLGVVLVNELIAAAARPAAAVRPLAEPAAARRIAVATVAGRRWPPAEALAGLLQSRGTASVMLS